MEVFLFSLEAIYCLCNFPYCYYYVVLLSLLRIPYPEIVVDDTDQPHDGVHPLSPDREGCLDDPSFKRFPVVKVPSMDEDNEVRIVAWRITEEAFGQEAILNDNQPREETPYESVKRGGKYSGVFRIRSVFRVPGGDTHTMYGTAFVVNQFQAMTSAHPMWHAKLGPAKEVTLIKDAREQKNGVAMYTCLDAACYKSAIRSIVLQEQSPKHDLCMVSVSTPFELGIRALPLHPTSSLPYDEDGIIVGFPYDLPFNSAEKQVIRSDGPVVYDENDGIVSIKYKINTQKGNSGSPVIAGIWVVGVHYGYKQTSRRNEAAPVNRNGNNTEYLVGVLRHTRNQQEPDVTGGTRIRELRRVKGPEFPEQELRYYGLS